MNFVITLMSCLFPSSPQARKAGLLSTLHAAIADFERDLIR
jgi:hypothetical protein